MSTLLPQVAYAVHRATQSRGISISRAQIGVCLDALFGFESREEMQNDLGLTPLKIDWSESHLIVLEEAAAIARIGKLLGLKYPQAKSVIDLCVMHLRQETRCTIYETDRDFCHAFNFAAYESLIYQSFVVQQAEQHVGVPTPVFSVFEGAHEVNSLAIGPGPNWVISLMAEYRPESHTALDNTRSITCTAYFYFERLGRVFAASEPEIKVFHASVFNTALPPHGDVEADFYAPKES